MAVSFLSSVVNGIQNDITSSVAKNDHVINRGSTERTYDAIDYMVKGMLLNVFYNLDNSDFDFGAEFKQITELVNVSKETCGLRISFNSTYEIDNWSYEDGICFPIESIRINRRYSTTVIDFVGTENTVSFEIHNISGLVYRINDGDRTSRNVLDLDNIDKLSCFNRNVVMLLRKLHYDWR